MKTTRRSYTIAILTIAALLFGLLALALALLGLTGGGSPVDKAMAPLNLATGLAGVVGAIAYGVGKQWWRWWYGLSVLGHVGAHSLLLRNAVERGRLTPFTILGVAAIPVLTVSLFAIMVWQGRKHVPL